MEKTVKKFGILVLFFLLSLTAKASTISTSKAVIKAAGKGTIKAALNSVGNSVSKSVAKSGGTIRPAENFPQEFIRTQWILNYLKVPVEPSYQSELAPLNGLQSQVGLQNILRYLDPKGGFKQFSSIDTSGTPTLHVFQDRVSNQVEDFQVTLGTAQKFTPLFPHLSPSPGKPLQGLRIALDPGHMGGDFWDELTGRAVYEKKGKQGRKLSEGMLTLETCLLLKDQFEKWGAIVFVTHETAGPVTTLQLKDLKPSDYAPEEIQQDTLTSWFLNLVQNYIAGPQLALALDKNPQIKKLSSESMRDDDFILHEDIDTRARLISSFNPDITLIIHYNTSDPVGDSWGLSKGYDRVGTYVAGGYGPEEFGSRKWRKQFAQHLLNPATWQSSINLSREILTLMRENLSILPDRSVFPSAVEIEPGIQARNLGLTRQLPGLTMSYVECLYYNDPAEFFEIIKNDHVMTIGGVQTYYSDRIAQVAATLSEAVLSFVGKASANSISN